MKTEVNGEMRRSRTALAKQTSIPDPELHDSVVVSSNDIWYDFETALLVEADRSGVVLMHHQHEPIWLLFGVPRPLASHPLSFCN
jgi:hypothetical protein